MLMPRRTYLEVLFNKDLTPASRAPKANENVQHELGPKSRVSARFTRLQPDLSGHPDQSRRNSAIEKTTGASAQGSKRPAQRPTRSAKQHMSYEAEEQADDREVEKYSVVVGLGEPWAR